MIGIVAFGVKLNYFAELRFRLGNTPETKQIRRKRCSCFCNLRLESNRFQKDGIRFCILASSDQDDAQQLIDFEAVGIRSRQRQKDLLRLLKMLTPVSGERSGKVAFG